MTTQLGQAQTRGITSSDDLEGELRQVLHDGFLPAGGDQILAALLARHAPGRLLWDLASMPTNRSFNSFAEVVSACECTTAPGGSTWW